MLKQFDIRRWLAVVLAAAMVLLSLTACGGSAGDGENATTTAPATQSGGAPSEVPALRINEYMTDNAQTNAANSGDYYDWVELFNGGEAAVSLAGMFLSDNPEKPNKWAFPAGTVLDAGA